MKQLGTQVKERLSFSYFFKNSIELTIKMEMLYLTGTVEYSIYHLWRYNL